MTSKKRSDDELVEEGWLVRLGDGQVMVPSEWGIDEWGPAKAALLPAGVDVKMQMRVVDGIPQCTELRFIARGSENGGIRAQALRDFRLEDWIERACDGLTLPYNAPDDWTSTEGYQKDAMKEVRKARARSRGGYTDELLREVAETYEQHVEDRPTRAVREVFGIAQSTAQLYVKKARERGFLTVDAPNGGRS